MNKDTNTPEILITPIPNTPFQRQMAQGHKNRTGHALRGHQVSQDGMVWATVRECCGENDAQRLPKTWAEVVPPIGA